MTTDLEAAEGAAGESISLFRVIFEQSPISTQIFATDGRTLAVNPAWERLWGIGLEDLRGYNILQDQQLVEKGIMPYIMRGFAGEALDIPAIRYIPDETIPGTGAVPYRWVSAHIYPVRGADGVIRHIVLMHEDITERKLAEESLKASEERFHAIVDSAPIGISLLDPAGRYIAVNPARQEMLGYSEEELIGQHYLDVTHPEDIAYDLRVNEEARQLGKDRYQLEKRFVRRDGETRWSRITIRTVHDESDEILYSISVAEDVTESKRMEEALRAAEEKYRTLVELLPVAAYTAPDTPGATAYVSPAIERLLGYSREDWTGTPDFWPTVIHPDDRERILRRDREVRETGERFLEEFRVIDKAGEVHWVRDEAIVVHDAEGHTWLHGVYVDITDKKGAEEERARLFELERTIRINMERLAAEREAILSQIAEGVIMADPSGRITFVNEEARRIYGIVALGVTPDRYSDVYHVYTLTGEPFPSLELPLSRAVLRGETVVNQKLVVHRLDGREVVAEVSATPVVAEDGTRMGAVLAVRDITSQYNLERQKDDFLSAAAHDLRTPLTSMKGRIQLLRRRAERDSLETETLTSELDRIDMGLRRMTSLISELLDVANIQIGRPLVLERRPMDLVALAREVAAEQQHVSDRHEVTVDAETPVIAGSWDATRLERVLGNLLSTAIKYSPEGGAIRVRVDQENDWAVLSVTDEGIGIPAGDLPYVFDRFRRGENAAGKIPGTGIGLTAVRDIVERHGGTITAENRDPAGAVFTVRLPLSPSGLNDTVSENTTP
jgi:PAS domain S-box-containing protein